MESRKVHEHPQPSIVQALTEKLKQYPYVQKVMLYGSRARGDEDERSDIDLAVTCPGATRQEWTHLWSEAEDMRTLYFIDLVRLDEASEGLQKRILDEGITLYERH